MHDVAHLHVQPHIPTSSSSLLNTNKWALCTDTVQAQHRFMFYKLVYLNKSYKLFEVPHNISELYNKWY